MNAHNEKVREIASRLQDSSVTTEEKNALQKQWEGMRDEAIDFSETFKGIMAKSYGGANPLG